MAKYSDNKIGGKKGRIKPIEKEETIPASLHDKPKNLVPNVKVKEEVVEKTAPVKLPKPRHKIGETVLVNFIGTTVTAEIIECRPHPSQPRWIYKVKDSAGTIIPWVGVDGQEQFSNIVNKK